MKEENQGTVTITTEEYNRLRDFKNTMEADGLSVTIIGRYDHHTEMFYTNNTALKLLSSENASLKQRIKDLENRSFDLEKANFKLKEVIDNIKSRVKKLTWMNLTAFKNELL